MKKKYRVTKNEEFDEIIKQRHKISNPCFNIYYRARKESYARIGISVSKRHGDAVKRNLIKRQLREIIKNLVDFDEQLFDCIIVVKDGFLHNSFLDNQNNLEKLLKKVIIKKYVKGVSHE